MLYNGSCLIEDQYLRGSQSGMLEAMEELVEVNVLTEGGRRGKSPAIFTFDISITALLPSNISRVEFDNH